MALIRPIPKTDLTFGTPQTASSPLTLEVGKTYFLMILTDQVTSGANTIISGADIVVQPTKFVNSVSDAQVDYCVIKPTSTSVTISSRTSTNLTTINSVEVE